MWLLRKFCKRVAGVILIVPAIACDFILYVLTNKSTQAQKWEATLQLFLMPSLMIIWLGVIATLLDFFFDVSFLNFKADVFPAFGLNFERG